MTLFGESSGSGMTHLLMMSPSAKGLFHKAILMSGSATSPCKLSLSFTKVILRKQNGAKIVESREYEMI